MLVGVVADVVDYLHGIEAFAAGVGGADVLAAGARGTRPGVNQLPPSVLRVGADSERVDVQILQWHCLAVVANRQWSHLAGWIDVVEEDVGDCHQQVHVLRERNQHEEHGDGEHVSPIGRHSEMVRDPVLGDRVPYRLPEPAGVLLRLDNERRGGYRQDEQ